MQSLLVTDKRERVESAVPGTKMLLLEHQTYMVRAMLDKEQQYYDFLAGRAPVTRHDATGPRRAGKRAFNGSSASNACVLADRPGTGKTYEILALIALRPFPGMAPEPLAFYAGCETRAGGAANRKLGMRDCWRLQYSCVHKTNLIFVGKTVLKYWQETIANSTNLRTWVIEDVRDLREFYEYVFRPRKDGQGRSLARLTTTVNGTTQERFVRRLDGWDVILVKNGTVSGSLDLPELAGTWMENAKTRNIVGLFGLLFRNQCFGRVILDDYDTLGIVSSSLAIPSMYTWYVSATRPSRTSGTKRPVPRTLWDQLRLARPLYNDINGLKEDFIGQVRISCAADLLERSLKIASVSHWLYALENTHDRLIGAMTDLEEEDLAEMLNANALHAAGEASKAKDLSVAGIFEHLLQSRYRQYCKLRTALRYAETLCWEDAGAGEPGARSFAPAEVKVRRNLEQGGPRAKLYKLYRRMTEGGRADLLEYVEEWEEETVRECGKIGACIRRVKENLTDGECPIMLTPLAESARLFILRCCSVVISEPAAEGLKREQLRGHTQLDCPKCRARLVANDVICIPQLRVNDILEERLEIDDGEMPVAPTEAQTEGTTEDSCERGNPKVQMVLDILLREECAERKKVSNPLPGLLEGSHSLGEATQEERKFLVFANHEEMLTQICGRLEAAGVGYRNLRGTTSQLNEIIARYKLPNTDPRSYRILLINGLQYCAGMNLQCTTDLVFTHWVARRNVACQIGGRAARHGRLRDLQLHYVLYNNEVEAFAAAT